MPDSYFAFLSNQKKLAEPEKINGAMKELARGSDTASGAKSKVRSRQSQPQLASATGAPGSKPSVPSLPSIQRTSTQPAATHSSGPRLPTGKSSAPSSNPILGSKPPSQPRLGAKPPSSPQIAANMSMRNLASAPAVDAPGKSNALVFTLVGILVAAIVVLAYLVLTK
jgi:hypothetical protein